MIADKNQTSCICQEGYSMNDLGKCFNMNGSKIADNSTLNASK
jgi:hypothetical protein